MENVSLNMDSYFHRLKRLLNCPGPVRASFLDRTRRMAEDFIRSNPDATSQDVADFLGDPQELARGFLETLEPDALERYQKRKRFLYWGCFAVLTIALIIATVFGIYFQRTPLDLETTETIVIYGDLTYKETTEEIS